MKSSFLFLIASFIFTSVSWGAEQQAHLIAVGQGIAAPNSTSTINFSNGFTPINPVGVIYQEGFRLSGHFIQDGTTNNDGMGAEIGYGGNGWGLAAGSFTFDCDSCEASSAAAAAIEVGNWVAMGLRFEEELYGIGLIFNSSGSLRLGINASLNDPEGDDNNITTYGVGLAYYTTDLVFALDASTIDTENPANDNDIIFMTAGVSLHKGMLQFSVNHRSFINDDLDVYENADKLWFGIGLGEDMWHFAFYSDYVSDTALELSVMF